jgi:hypothetical protein
MNCSAFESWLDRGREARERASALAHAGACERCARSLTAAAAVDLLLAQPPASAPHGFGERVMRRVAAVRRPLAAHVFEHPVEWWVRLAAEPAAALALVLAALLAWRGDLLLRAVPLVSRWSAGASVALTAASPSSLAHVSRTPLIALAFALAALPIVLWISWRAFVWVERACVPAHPATGAA